MFVRDGARHGVIVERSSPPSGLPRRSADWPTTQRRSQFAFAPVGLVPTERMTARRLVRMTEPRFSRGFRGGKPHGKLGSEPGHAAIGPVAAGCCFWGTENRQALHARL